MRTLLIALALGCAGLVCNSSSSMAAAPQKDGQIPNQVLADVGLSGMQPMTDAQGMEVRGKGFSVNNYNVVFINGNVNNVRYLNITQIIIVKHNR